MSLEVTMPQMGESVVEGIVTKWLVKEGDQVQQDQPLCEISTDKVDTEIPSPGAGVITKLVATEGQTLPVGALIAVIESAGGQARTEADKPPPPAPLPSGAAQAPSPPARHLTDRLAATHAQAQIAPARESRSAAAIGGSADVQPSNTPTPPERPPVVRPTAVAGGPPRRYSPVVLRIAAEHGVDLSLVPGTGIGGRVSKRDIERYLEALQMGRALPRQSNGTAAEPTSGGPPPGPSETPASTIVMATPPAIPASAGTVFRPPVYQPRDGDQIESFTRRRKLIAEHMVYSKTHSPHVGTVAEVDLTKLMALRETHKEAFQKREGFSLTLLPFAAMATIRALRDFPRMNASVVGDSVVIRREINLGIAMDAEEGLVVPVIKGADTFTVVGLAREIEGLRRKVQNKTITANDLAGGSFTLSNPGREGNLYGFAIINQPQVGILRMGEVKKRSVVMEVEGADALAIRTIMYLALSYDHRVIDGVLGNRFLYRTARLLEEAEFEL
jgi:pyruvate/2-oxoglutarate dehydrogenase complex dihydrolipoamide acyltransferase (E2) component